MIKNFVKILELLGDRLEVCVSVLCLLIVWGMTLLFKVHLSFYAIPLLTYDVMYITTIP